LTFAGLEALASLGLIRSLYHNQAGRAFLWSSATILFLFVLCALGNFPSIIRSTLNNVDGITIYNASSSQKTLSILLIIVAIGIPFVLAYTFWLYKTFRGKVVIDSHSY